MAKKDVYARGGTGEATERARVPAGPGDTPGTTDLPLHPPKPASLHTGPRASAPATHTNSALRRRQRQRGNTADTQSTSPNSRSANHSDPRPRLGLETRGQGLGTLTRGQGLGH
eukprot:gene13891-biopygen17053